MPPKRDKVTGLPLPSPVTPSTELCVQFTIPNAPEYKQALRGVLSELGKFWTWYREVGQGTEAANEAAELWRKHLMTLYFSDECGGESMSCLDVANCIETNLSVQQALAQQIEENAAIRQALAAANGGNQFYGEDTIPGIGLTPGQMSVRLNEIDECAFDPYWSQVEAFVDYLLDLGRDALEKLVVYTEAVNSGSGLVKQSGLIAKLKNGTTAAKVTEFLDWVADFMLGAYNAADDTANRNAIKCAIFCQNRDACLITLDGVWSVLNDRLGGILNPEDITSLDGLAETMVTLTFNPALALDVWLVFMIGSAKTAGILGLEGIDETINLVLAAAVNDANNDWETLCLDCPPEPDNCWNMTEDDPLITQRQNWVLGEGISRDDYRSRPDRLTTTLDLDIRVFNRAKLTYNQTFTGNAMIRNTAGSDLLGNTVVALVKDYVWATPQTQDMFRLDTRSVSGSLPSGLRLLEVCLWLEE